MTAYRITTTTLKDSVVTIAEYDNQSAMWSAKRDAEVLGTMGRIYIESLIADHGWVEWSDKSYTTEDHKRQRRNNARIANELKAVKKVVESAIRLGYMVTVYDGEEYCVKRSTDKALIMANVYQTDMDSLSFRDAQGAPHGSVLFVYGNQASEVMNDWTDNAQVNDILADALAFCEKLAEKGE